MGPCAAVYKVEEPVGLVAESFDGTMRWPISADVANRLGFRKGIAPVGLEKALKAHHSLGVWGRISTNWSTPGFFAQTRCWARLGPD